MTIVICGAGIGGLTLARVCDMLNVPYKLLEATSSLKLEGAGIQLSPNAMRVLNGLGLGPQIIASGHQPIRGEIYSANGNKLLLDFPLAGETEARFGAPYVQIQRGKLIDILADGINIQFDRRIDQVTTQPREAIVKGAWGQETGTFVVGADGIHSTVRSNIWCNEYPKYTGYLAWRAVISSTDLKHTLTKNASVTLGKSGHVVTYQLSETTLNFVGVLKSRNIFEENWMIEGSKTEALEVFSEFGPRVTDIIEVAPIMYKWGLFDRPALSSFHKGSAAIMGDAAHPILPFLAQGGAMAIEDAWALGHALKLGDIEIYSKLRAQRVKRVQQASKNQAHVYHLSNPIKEKGFEFGMRLTNTLMPMAGLRRLGSIYGYDIIKETKKLTQT